MSTKMKKCPDCGAQIPVGTRYCGRCGYDTRGDDRVEMLPRPVRAVKTPRPTETSRWPEPEDDRYDDYDEDDGRTRNLWRIAIVLAAIVVVLVIAVVLVVQMNRRPQSTQQPESESFNAVHVIGSDGETIDVTATPAATPATERPAETPEPTPDEKPTPTPEPTATPEPTEAPIDIVEVDDTVYVTGSSVNLRSGPGTDYDVIGSVSRGQKLSRTGKTDSWSRVEYNGHTCYISSSLVSTEEPEATATPSPDEISVTEKNDTVVVTAEANLRSGPGTGYEVLSVAQKGTELTRTGVSGSWSQVIADGKKAFIFNDLIEVKGGASDTDETGTLTVTADANIRSGPGTDYGILGSVTKGTKLDMTGHTSTNWYKISYNGQTGYIAGNLVTKD